MIRGVLIFSVSDESGRPISQDQTNEESFFCWPLAVGRWPLAVPLIAGGLLMAAPPAHAGSWGTEPRPVATDACSGYCFEDLEKAWQERNLKITGTASSEGSEWDTGTHSQVAGTMEGTEPWTAVPNTWQPEVTAYGASKAESRVSNTLSWRFIWTPSAGRTLQQDPPTKFFTIPVQAYAFAQAQTGGFWMNGDPYVRNPSDETVSAKVTMGDKTANGEPVDYSEWGLTATSANANWIGVKNSGGESEVWGPEVKVEGEAKVASGLTYSTGSAYSTPSPKYGLARVGHGITFGSPTPADVTISSTIQKSWKKWVGSASDLPNDYKQRDETGALTGEPNEDAQLVFSDPTNPSKNVWKIANLRAPEGAMIVDSAASWMTNNYNAGLVSPDNSPDTTSNWFGSVGLSSSWPNLPEPSYAWSWSGGTLDGASVSDAINQDSPGVSLYFSYQPDSLWNPDQTHPEGINLGGSRIGPGTTQSTVDLRVTSPLLGLDAKPYTINWHAPYEKQDDLPPTRGKQLMGAVTAVPYTGRIDIPPVEPESIDISAGLEAAAGAFGASTGGASGAAVALSIAQGISGLLDLKWEYGGKAGYSFENGDNDWDKTQASPEWAAENFSPPASSAWTSEEEGFTAFDVTMKLTKRWTNVRWEADEYDANGFVGSGRVLFYEKEHVIDHEPHYSLRPDKTATPPTGGGGQ